jgi:hypothetical protein
MGGFAGGDTYRKYIIFDALNPSNGGIEMHVAAVDICVAPEHWRGPGESTWPVVSCRRAALQNCNHVNMINICSILPYCLCRLGHLMRPRARDQRFHSISHIRIPYWRSNK